METYAKEVLKRYARFNLHWRCKSMHFGYDESDLSYVDKFIAELQTTMAYISNHASKFKIEPMELKTSYDGVRLFLIPVSSESRKCTIEIRINVGSLTNGTEGIGLLNKLLNSLTEFLGKIKGNESFFSRFIDALLEARNTECIMSSSKLEAFVPTLHKALFGSRHEATIKQKMDAAPKETTEDSKTSDKTNDAKTESETENAKDILEMLLSNPFFSLTVKTTNEEHKNLQRAILRYISELLFPSDTFYISPIPLLSGMTVAMKNFREEKEHVISDLRRGILDRASVDKTMNSKIESDERFGNFARSETHKWEPDTKPVTE